MMNHYIGTALARERRGTLLAEAEAARGARQATRIALRDGSEVLIRPVQSTDAPLLAEGFARLSPASRWMRFLTPKKQLSSAELSYLTDLDHHDHEALGALDRSDGRGIGIARYIRQADDPQAADIAVTIIDDWQGRGLGSELLARLSDRARQEGIHRFIALVAAENAPVAAMLRKVCARLVRRDSNTLEYEISLDGIAFLDVLAAQLRARGWTAYVSTPAGRPAVLSVPDPHIRTEWSYIVVAPGGAGGEWWYWFSWAERIAPVHAPATAADAVITALQRITGGAVGAGGPAAGRGSSRA
jgi:RimJ/RimL family protein N-acetyltransferase